MKRVNSVFLAFALVLFSGVLTTLANAQGGCGMTVIEELPVKCCGGLYTQPDFNCGPGGPQGNLCVEGYGQCCSVSYGTANAGPSPECAPPPTCCTGGVTCGYRQFCLSSCTCGYASPVIVDTTGNGFRLTTAADGVIFDITGDGTPIKMAWTAADSGNAFLALDRNHNGKLTPGKSRSGTSQPNRNPTSLTATWPWWSSTDRRMGATEMGLSTAGTQYIRSSCSGSTRTMTESLNPTSYIPCQSWGYSPLACTSPTIITMIPTATGSTIRRRLIPIRSTEDPKTDAGHTTSSLRRRREARGSAATVARYWRIGWTLDMTIRSA